MQFGFQNTDLEGNIQRDMHLHDLMQRQADDHDSHADIEQSNQAGQDISELFQDEIPDHKKALNILQEALPIARSKYLFESTTPFMDNEGSRPRYDGVIRSTAESLDRSERHLGREIREESPVLKYHFASIGLRDQEITPTDDVQETYEKINTLYETLAPTDQASIESPGKVDTYSSLEQISLGKIEEPLARNEMFESLPFEGKLYAKAIELGASDKTYTEAKRDFEAFYLSEVFNTSLQQADSYKDFLDNSSRMTGYRKDYLPDKSKEYFGCTPHQCWQQYLQ